MCCFFFFFKQKTAYEMRISDWSSDVCSSDLDDLAGHAQLAQRSNIRICGAEFAATRFEVREWIEVGKVHVVQPDISRCGGLTEKIGRASCRERVCQYV